MQLILCSKETKDMVIENNKILEKTIQTLEDRIFFKSRIKYYKKVRAKALLRIKKLSESIKIILDDNNQYLYPVVNNQDKLDENNRKFKRLDAIRDSFYNRANIAEKTIKFFRSHMN
jgi:hypothetical protein